MILKSSGVGQRRLGIQTIRDRVVQAAAVMTLGFERSGHRGDLRGI
jgi:retron-type reverse transcriptase